MRKSITHPVCIAFFLMIAVAAHAQTTGQYRTKASGSWTAIATWERYNGTTWATPDHTPTYLDGITTIRSGNVVTLPSGSVTIDQLTIESGATLTLQSGSTLGLYNGPSTDFTCNGLLDMLDGSTIARIALTPSTSISGTVKVGKATVDAPLVMNSSAFLFLNDGSNINDSIYNNNVTTISSGTINFTTGVFINEDSVIFTGAGAVSCVLQKISGVNSFVNHGSLLKDAGVTGVTLNASINLTNTGTIDFVQLPAGNSAIINSGTFINSGTLKMYSEATAGSMSLTNSALSVITLTTTSIVTIENPAAEITLLTNSGTISLNVPIVFPAYTTTNLVAGSVVGTGSITVNGTLNHNGGSVSVPLTLGGSTTYNINSAAGISLNANVIAGGIVNWSGGDIHMGNNANFSGNGNAFNITTDNAFDMDVPGNTSTFTCKGTLTKSTTTGTTTFGVNVIDSGVFNINTGTIKTTALCTLANLVNFTSGTALQNDGTITFNPIAKIKGNGSLTNNGTLVANLNLKIPGSIPFTNNGNISGTGTLKLPGSYTQGGGIISVPLTISGDCTISGPGLTFNGPVVNKGVINWNAGNITINNTTFSNSKNKDFNINTIDFTEINGSGAALFTNAGNMLKTLSTTTTISIPLTNTPDGEILGIGWYQMLSTFTNNGTIDPGVENFGRLIFTGNPTSSTSVLRMQVKKSNANGHDIITVEAGTTLSGTLTLTQVGSAIEPGTINLINSSGGLTGTFSTINKPEGWEVTYTTFSVDVTIPAAVSPAATQQNDAIATATGTTQLKFYPNPVKDVLYVQLPASVQNATINILSINGSLVQRISSTESTTKIQIAALPKGTYLLQVISGAYKTSQKFIKD